MSVTASVRYEFLEAPRLQQRPGEPCRNGGGWFASRPNGWTSCPDHEHATPEEASRCFWRAVEGGAA